jgi:hypothetical protein
VDWEERLDGETVSPLSVVNPSEHGWNMAVPGNKGFCHLAGILSKGRHELELRLNPKSSKLYVMISRIIFFKSLESDSKGRGPTVEHEESIDLGPVGNAEPVQRGFWEDADEILQKYIEDADKM